MVRLAAPLAGVTVRTLISFSLVSCCARALAAAARCRTAA
jgi:hypothetical protein